MNGLLGTAQDVTALLDAGGVVVLRKCAMGSYVAVSVAPGVKPLKAIEDAVDRGLGWDGVDNPDGSRDFGDELPGVVMTDGFEVGELLSELTALATRPKLTLSHWEANPVRESDRLVDADPVSIPMAEPVEDDPGDAPSAPPPVAFPDGVAAGLRVVDAGNEFREKLAADGVDLDDPLELLEPESVYAPPQWTRSPFPTPNPKPVPPPHTRRSVPRREDGGDGGTDSGGVDFFTPPDSPTDTGGGAGSDIGGGFDASPSFGPGE